jgi:hypothetical protein
MGPWEDMRMAWSIQCDKEGRTLSSVSSTGGVAPFTPCRTCVGDGVMLSAATKQDLAVKIMEHAHHDHGMSMRIDEAMDLVEKQGRQAA